VDDGDPEHITYTNNLEKPVIFVDIELNKANYPNLLPLRGTESGSAAIVPASN
jgi:hypothetical protein